MALFDWLRERQGEKKLVSLKQKADQMQEYEKGSRLEGTVHARLYDASASGKQFLGATIETSDAKIWVIDYEEQSPFHAFDCRQVIAFGEPYRPKGQYLIGGRGGKTLEHFHPSCVRLVEGPDDAQLFEVGAPYNLRGRFQLGPADTGESMLSFVTEKGEVFVVANEPAGVRMNISLQVSAYPVQLSPALQRPPERYLWIICPYSADDLWKWRNRRS